jgi:hypothetical protein
MQNRSFTSSGRCWISDGPKGAGKETMRELTAARKAGMSVSAFICAMSQDDPANDEHVAQVYLSTRYELEDDGYVEEEIEQSLPYPSPAFVFASLEYHLDGFHVTTRP